MGIRPIASRTPKRGVGRLPICCLMLCQMLHFLPFHGILNELGEFEQRSGELYES